jgi:predicted helicase
LRKCLAQDFQSIYVVNLRGDIRKNILSGGKEEGGNVFGQASQTGAAIAFLVKNSSLGPDRQIYYHDIGQNLSGLEKLERLKSFRSISGIEAQNGWTKISPNAKGDWKNQRDDSLSSFIIIGDKKHSITLADNS